MAELCFDVLSENESSSAREQSSRATRGRMMELRRFKFAADLAPPSENEAANGVCDLTPVMSETVESRGADKGKGQSQDIEMSASRCHPPYGVASVCGRRREMEDAVAIHLNFCSRDDEDTAGGPLHYFGLYDGHGCSHVAEKCSERLHELLGEELEKVVEAWPAMEWKLTMERSFHRMDEEVTVFNTEAMAEAKCRCKLRTPDCDAVGSTAVIAIVTPSKIVIANCGDSRAVLSRGGKALALSSDHKPDRPDELNRIEEAGGRVIYWDGARVLGVLAMSRAIGDSYLKPYVSCEPEVTVVDRTADDECLILGTDGLWDVISNDTACGVARTCLIKGKKAREPPRPGEGAAAERACSDASMLLTRLALARHSTDNVSIVVVDLRKPDIS